MFAAKYRRKVIYKKIKADVGRILSELCKRKGVEIIEAEACPDHVHMFVRIPPKYSVSEVMGYLKPQRKPPAKPVVMIVFRFRIFFVSGVIFACLGRMHKIGDPVLCIIFRLGESHRHCAHGSLHYVF